jgi:osmotically-inducible protein OsmY
MIRALFRLVLVVVILAAAAAFFLGYRLGDDGVETPVSARQAPTIDTAKAREAGAKVGETVATGAAQAQQSLSDGALTAKIKAKMALDDTISATSIDIDTNGTVVTLSGTVRSEAERTKAVQLAKDTAGVTQVVDRLAVR